MRWLRSAAMALALAGAPLALAGCGDSEASRPTVLPRPPAPLAVTAVAAEERLVPQALEVTGALAADAQADVAAEIAARVVEVRVERGTPVKAGDVLVRLDDVEARNQLREAEALERQTRERLGMSAGQEFDPAQTPEARKARLAMERAEAEYRRYERLVEMGAVSRSDHDLRRMEYTTAREQLEAVVNQMREMRASLDAQQARVARARKALADTVIRAPFEGVVAEKHVNVGQFAQPGMRVATLVRVDPLRVELTVPESAAASVRRGQRVSFAVQTHPDRRFQGTVAYVGPALRADARALVAEALVPNPDRLLQPGLFATARVELPAREPRVFVPAASVRGEAGTARLFVVRDGRAEMRVVQLGQEVDGWVEVVRGVAPRERVITDPVDRVADGADVVETAGAAGPGGAAGAAGPRAER